MSICLPCLLKEIQKTIYMRSFILAMWKILSFLLAVCSTLVSLMSIMEWSENPYSFGYLILGVGCLFMAFYLTKD